MELNIKLENIENNNRYKVSVDTLYDIENQEIFIGETEISHIDKEKNPNIKSILFETPIKTKIFYERVQFLKFCVKNLDTNKIFKYKYPLINVISNKKSPIVKKFNGEETLVINANVNNILKEIIQINLYLHKNNSHLFRDENFYYKIEVENRKGRSAKLIFKSFEQKFKKKNSMELSKYLLNANRINLHFDEFDNKNLIFSLIMNDTELNEETVVEKVTLSYSELNKNSTINFNKNGNLNFELITKSLRNYSFHDYLNYGFNLCVGMAIDFTSSNRHPTNEKSFHYWFGVNENPYERAMKICLRISSQYDKDNKYPLYGYGAIPPGETNVNHCFNLNFKYDAEISGIDNCIKVYREALNKLTFKSPTYLTPCLREFIKEFKKTSYDLCNYGTLLILTDGNTNDRKEFIDAIVEASYLPLSIIIVGVGTADFKKMEIFDADNSRLVDSKGKYAFRDILNFVPFEKFKHDTKSLGDEFFFEIPTQITEYFALKGIKPHHLKK